MVCGHRRLDCERGGGHRLFGGTGQRTDGAGDERGASVGLEALRPRLPGRPVRHRQGSAGLRRPARPVHFDRVGEDPGVEQARQAWLGLRQPWRAWWLRRRVRADWLRRVPGWQPARSLRHRRVRPAGRGRIRSAPMLQEPAGARPLLRQRAALSLRAASVPPVLRHLRRPRAEVPGPTAPLSQRT